jgi:hypothetical protein
MAAAAAATMEVARVAPAVAAVDLHIQMPYSVPVLFIHRAQTAAQTTVPVLTVTDKW